MPMQAESMEEAVPFDHLRLALVGEEKSWKSRTAATGRKETLFLDYDRRRQAVAGIKGVHAVTLMDPGGYKQPTAYGDTLDIIGRMEDSVELFGGRVLLKHAVPELNVPDDLELKTLVFPDSVTTFSKAAMAHALYNTKEIRREIVIPGSTLYIPGGWDAWKAEMDLVESILLRAFALPIDVISVFHEVDEETADSTSESPKYTGKKAVYPVRHRALIKYFTELWRLKLVPSDDDYNKFVAKAQTAPDYNFTAATAFEGLEQFENPNIEELINKHISHNQTQQEEGNTSA